jgi:hypothetical protein
MYRLGEIRYAPEYDYVNGISLYVHGGMMLYAASPRAADR